jgi:hypothetical protein
VSGMPAVFTATATPGPVHHFTFAAIGDQVETYAFTITVTAEDAFGNTVIAYTAPVALTDTTGTINPPLSGSFVGGVLTQAVTINAEGTGVSITATHTTTPTVAGASNPFDVIPVHVVNLNTGEWFVTIQDAIDDADTLSGAGHVISVTAGRYNENVNVTKSDITLTGVGAGADPAHHTIIDGLTPADIGGSPGINLPSGVTGITIRNLRVQSFHNSSGINAAGRNDDFVVSNTHVYSNALNLGFANGGIYMNGPVTHVLVTGSELQYNKGRGFVIWNGFKQHITVTNNVVRYNNCCGIELQDGTASGVLIAGNVVEENADNGIGLVGLTSGGGANRVFSNALRDNGRFGIEIKLPDGTGLESGDGSIVVEENRVERTFVPADARDLAGIAVFRRSWIPGNGNVDVPTGVVIRDNAVTGYVQTTSSDGFGIVVEGTTMTVLSNTVANNDVGIQIQAGHQSYVPNTDTDGDQSNLEDEYFGRGNSPVGEGWLGANVVVNNGVGIRAVNGTLTAMNNVISGSTSAGVVLMGAGTVTATLGGDPPSANVFRENGPSGVTHATVTLPYTNPAVHAYYNDWNAVALADLEDAIYHQADDSSLAEVVYYDLVVDDDGSSPMADGVSCGAVTATVVGLLQPAGHVVSFTTDLGTLGVVTGTTGVGGAVATVITSISDGTATITGTAGMESGKSQA